VRPAAEVDWWTLALVLVALLVWSVVLARLLGTL
jgi:hypothetical protein